MATFTGTSGNDVLTGGPDDDDLFGQAGDDTLNGAEGADSVLRRAEALPDGGDGTDYLVGDGAY